MDCHEVIVRAATVIRATFKEFSDDIYERVRLSSRPDRVGKIRNIEHLVIASLVEGLLNQLSDIQRQIHGERHCVSVMIAPQA